MIDCRWAWRSGPRSLVGAAIALMLAALSILPSEVRAIPTVAEIQAMQSYLEQNGLVGFREAVAANNWQAPVMPSKWFADNRSASAALPAITAARQLGLTIVRKTDEWAPLMRSDSGADLMDHALRLVEVAEWTGAVDGYGNLHAAGHACEVAITGLARFVADIEFPLADVKANIARCDLPISSAAGASRVLNQELGAEILPASPGTTFSELDRIWTVRRSRALFLQHPDKRQELDVLFAELVSELDKLGLDPDEPDPHAEFFVRKEACGAIPATTETCWDISAHYAVAHAVPLYTQIMKLHRLILFRETIGAFPTEPRAKGVFWGDRSQAFDEAWDVVATPETKNLGGAAENVLTGIETGTFLDTDTVMRQRPSSRTAIAKTAAAQTETPSPVGTPSP